MILIGKYIKKKEVGMEEKINLCINLLEIAKTYCDFNYDKTAEVPIIGSLLEIILNIQKEQETSITDIPN